MNLRKAEVLIVGAGPTGLTAALELSRFNISVRLIEKNAEPATTSRALGVQARTLELFEQRGVVEPMLREGIKGLGGSIYGEGKRIFRMEFSHNGSDYGFLLFISQAKTEAILSAALEKQGVAIERQVELIALAQTEHGDSVKAILKHGDGSLEEFHCAYLIDAEGAHSISRATLDLPFKGKTRHEEFALGDLYLDGDLPSTDFHIFSSAFGFMGLFPLAANHFRLIASNPLSDPVKVSAPSLEELQQIYDQRSHIPARFHDLRWSSWFRINSRMVDRLRVGRVFLGGDAAHIHSPAGGQGMNTGIQDMINLAWKLAYVIKGQANPKLLDTYTDDRIPVIRHVLTRTEGLTDVISIENPIFRSVFSQLAPWIVGTQFVQESSTEQISQLSLNYRDSPLSETHGGAHELKAGDRVPNMQILKIGGEAEAGSQPDQQRLWHLLDPDRFTLFFANLTDPAAMHNFVQTTLSPWRDLIQTRQVASAPGQEQSFQSVFGFYSSIVLVRPDGYAAFFGTENSLSSLVNYLRAWFPTQKQAEQESTHA